MSRKSATTGASEGGENDIQSLLQCIADAGLTGPHLEIGTAAGGTLVKMMGLYKDGARPRFVVVDPMKYFADQQRVVEQNIVTHGLPLADVEFRVAKSVDAVKGAAARGERFSFIFIDAIHSAEAVMQDLGWSALLEPGGILALHDYSAKFPGVVWAVDRFLGRHKNYEIISRVGSMIVLKKTYEAPLHLTEWDHRLARVVAAPLKWKRSVTKRLVRA